MKFLATNASRNPIQLALAFHAGSTSTTTDLRCLRTGGWGPLPCKIGGHCISGEPSPGQSLRMTKGHGHLHFTLDRRLFAPDIGC